MKNITNFAILGIITGVSLLSALGVQSASAHQLAVLFGDDHTNDIFFVLGHTNEPAFGVNPGIHDGKHALEIRLSDDATDLSLPEGNTELFFDKYYFGHVTQYNKAISLEDATQVVKKIPIGEAFGDPGHYIHRQIVQDGIYGYHVYGTIDYYGVGTIPIDLTFFCAADGMDNPTKFENIVGGITFGEFGCPESIKELKFPSNIREPTHEEVRDVVWINDVNVAITDNSLSKNSGERGWNAGAISTDSIISGNGYVETTIDETNTWRMIGLSKGDDTQHRNDIDFAAYFYGDGSLRVWENGQTLAIVGSYESGDVIRVEIDGSDVLYQKNGMVVHTSKDVITESNYPLLVDTALASIDATLKDVKIGIMREKSQ